MPQNLRFILDPDNDDHYTDSLIRLSSVPYIWYRLRRGGMARRILFLQVQPDNQLAFHVCDDESREHLLSRIRRRSSWFDRPVQPDTGGDHTLKTLNLEEEDVLSRLLATDTDAALVLTFDAFARICRSSTNKGAALLSDILDGKTNRSLIFIRLPSRAEELEKCLCTSFMGCAVLAKACSCLHSVSKNEREPLVKALSDLLGSQLIRLDDHTAEAYQLLLRQAIADDDCPDSLSELQDQADYLELCRMLRIKLLEPASESERLTPVPIRELDTMLRDPGFRDRLRSQVRQLRSTCPAGSVHAALAQERHLPKLPPLPAYRDELAQVALSLSIPDECKDKAELCGDLDDAKRSLITLWNRPRNSAVLQAADELCRSVRSAINHKNWETLKDAIFLLTFCAGQLCAAEDRNEALGKIWDTGRTIIALGEDLHSRSRFGMDGLDEFAALGIDQGDRRKLELLRSHIRNNIAYFDRPKMSMDDITRKIDEDWTILQTQLADDKKLEERLLRDLRQPMTAAVPADDDDFLFDLEAPPRQTVCTEPDPLPEPEPFFGADVPGESPLFREEPVREEPAAAPLDPNKYLQEHFYKKTSFFDETNIDDIDIFG